MTTYRLRYRTAATTTSDDQAVPAGPWTPAVDAPDQIETQLTSHTFAGLSNGIKYEFAVGRIGPGGLVTRWSTIPSATPQGEASGSYNTLGVFQVESASLKSIDRTTTKSILTMTANWDRVLVDYIDNSTGIRRRHGVPKTGTTVPEPFTIDANVIAKVSNQRVDIFLSGSQPVAISVVANGGSTAVYSLAAVV
jgi:hypothetical protein